VHVWPAWVTVKVWPPTVIVPVRVLVPGFAATRYETWPLPVPLAPAVTVIHETLLDAVHAQPLPAVTVMVPLTSAAPIDVLTGEIVNVHGTGASCVTVNVRPAIVTVPVRELVPVLAAIE
jgi:hypothetical protein